MQPALFQSSPVLVIGMHRSGSRLLSQILDALGVFMGADQQADSESVAFMLLNESILHQCGAFWSEPMSAHFLLSQPEFVMAVARTVGESLPLPLANYAATSSWQQALEQGDVRAFGWKDPRNTFTLPVWKTLFPRLRVIHLLRHGVDVAASLARRHARALQTATGETDVPALTVIRDHVLGILSSRRGWTLAEALGLWEQYSEKARLESADLGPAALEIRFEDIVADPRRSIGSIAQFCGVPDLPPAHSLFRAIQSGRALAFQEEPALQAFALDNKAALERFGYAA